MLQSVERAVLRDFGDNVHVSHALHPSGLHIFCEVDTSGAEDTDFWGDELLEVVMRVFPLPNKNSSVNTEFLGGVYSKVPSREASFDSLLRAVRHFRSAPATTQDAGTEAEVDRLCRGRSHPNLAPVYGAFVGGDHLYLGFPPAPFTLQSILHYSPDALRDDWHIRFIFYQILAGLAYCHAAGAAHGSLSPSSILMDRTLWCSLAGFYDKLDAELVNEQEVRILKEPRIVHPLDWQANFRKWWEGDLSNFDYLLVLNRLAGRRWGDRCFHTVMPWVLDFSVKPDEENDAGWRDLTRSKWRLAKGDEQLLFTYATADIPHHVSDDCLSELAVCIYKARRLPLLVLRRVVRSVYEPNEYPGSMQRLYQWTPDECIPEFYSDPDVLVSTHSGMSDLGVPHWAKDAGDFIALHRSALESERVSKHLHHWIDLTFGYKLTGEHAIAAKNVALTTSGPTLPKASGRRQLFFEPHPMRRPKSRLPAVTSSLEQFEEANTFCEKSRYLSPWYGQRDNRVEETTVDLSPHASTSQEACRHLLNLTATTRVLQNELLDVFATEQRIETSYESFEVWRDAVSLEKPLSSTAAAGDVLAVGCLLAEVYLRMPLFDLVSAAVWLDTGVLPEAVNLLPPTVRVLVEATLAKDPQRRPTAKMLLDSPFFSPDLHAAFRFLSAFHFLACQNDRLRYAARMAQESSFLLMGPVATELSMPACLSLLSSPFADMDSPPVVILLKSFLHVLEHRKAKALLIPVIQCLLQHPEADKLKKGLLSSSFVRRIRRAFGTHLYLQHIHSLIVLSLRPPESDQAAAASAVLIDTCEELGLPVSLCQTVIPLFQSLGRDITGQGIKTFAIIGQRFGHYAIVKHFVPALRSMILLGRDSSSNENNGPTLNWRFFAAIDALKVLNRLLPHIDPASVVSELLLDDNNVYTKVLYHSAPLSLLQCAAEGLLSACSRAGTERVRIHVLSQLKKLFDMLAFEEKATDHLDGDPRSTNFAIVNILYPGLASLLGIEKLRQVIPTWLLLEQGLAKRYEWKWAKIEVPQNRYDSLSAEEPLSDFSPTSLLLDGIGWSLPTNRSPRSPQSSEKQTETTCEEPWAWLPFQEEVWAGAESFSRTGGGHALIKDEQSWKLNTVSVHSWRAHGGALRAASVGEDETVIFSGGGQRGQSVVRKWDMSTSCCTLDYKGHDEVVLDLCFLQGFERVASCDGTIHIWNSETGNCLSILDEASYLHPDEKKVAAAASDLSMSITGSSYTCMRFTDAGQRLLAGTANGFIRFIDPDSGRHMYSWHAGSFETSISSFVSSITSSCLQTLPSWLAIGFSSGHCSLLDLKSGRVIGRWKAHAGAITKLSPLEDKYLASSSMDKSMSIWDLRRGWPPPEPQTFQHTDGVTSFASWGNNIISAFGNKIGVLSVSNMQEQYKRKISTADKLSRNLSKINTINVLPFSRLFFIGTEDGQIKVCT